MITAQSPRFRLDAGMSRLSIPARLLLLSSVLLLILAGTSIFLTGSLNQNAKALDAEARYVEVLRTASAAEKAFGDLKYWLTDLAVSLLNLSEERANEAKHMLDEQLIVLEPYDPATIAVIDQHPAVAELDDTCDGSEWLRRYGGRRRDATNRRTVHLG